MITGLDIKQVLSARDFWRKNPEQFSKTFFGSTLWQKQKDIFNSVRDNNRTCVKSGNTCGKSKISAEIALWFLLSFYPAKVITTAPTFLQVEEILWKEIATLYKKSKIPIGGDLLNTELKLNDEWFALGISTDDVNRMQGFHSPHLLVILDEALGVDPLIWEAIEGLHPYRVLAIGNPLEPVGNFFNCFSSPLWNKITMSCVECVEWQKQNKVIPGLVTQQWIDERKEEWGAKSPLFQSRVLGEFPQEGTDTLIHLNWVDNCRKNILELDLDDLKILASDVARYGADKTVLLNRCGYVIEKITIKEKIPTTMIAGMIKNSYEDDDRDTLVVDDCGLGGGVTDMLVEQKIGVYPFNGGAREKPIDNVHFKNLRSQFWWITAKKLEKGLFDLSRIPQVIFERLKNELCSIRYTIESDGKIKVESKDDMKARGLHSPDVADSLVMSEYAFYMGKYSDIQPYMYRG